MSARDKIKTVAELAEYGKLRGPHEIVLAHGVFDQWHVGHVRHLEAAKREGTLLWVTVTSDRWASKAPGRPINSEMIRAEQVAACECVEFVAVHDAPGAPLEEIRPNVYAKGKEYERPEDDVTGKIVSEREAVERWGGRIVFTDEITFSSSAMINRYLDVYSPPMRRLLDRYRAENAYARIMDLIGAIEDYRLVFVGEVIVDEYIYVEPMGKAAKENILATRHIGKEIFAGGVIAAANHAAGLVREVEVVTSIGENDEDYLGTLKLVKDSLLPNVKLSFATRYDARTMRKIRYVNPSHVGKLFEVYVGDSEPYDDKTSRFILTDVKRAVEGASGVVVTDYDHGMMSPAIREACAGAGSLAANAQTNADNQGYNLITKYAGLADYVCVDAPEARLATVDRWSELEEIVRELVIQADCTRAIVTSGEHGCLTCGSDMAVTRVPAFTSQVRDSMGAGDAFLAATAPLVAAGGRMDLVGFVGNAAGAIKVGIVGHKQPVRKVDLIRLLTTVLK